MQVSRPPDVELFLCRFVRESLTVAGFPDVWVDRREWTPTAGGSEPAVQVIVRDDSGPVTSDISQDVQVGVSVLAGTLEHPVDARTVAAVVASILRRAARVEPGNPVAAVQEFNGPFTVVEESAFARFYMTVVFTVVWDVFESTTE